MVSETYVPAGWIVWDTRTDRPVYGYGPYEREGTAKAQCTRASRYHKWVARPVYAQTRPL